MSLQTSTRPSPLLDREMANTDTSREIDRLSRDKLSMPPGMKGILCIKFDLFKIKNTDFWAAILKQGFFKKV